MSSCLQGFQLHLLAACLCRPAFCSSKLEMFPWNLQCDFKGLVMRNLDLKFKFVATENSTCCCEEQQHTKMTSRWLAIFFILSFGAVGTSLIGLIKVFKATQSHPTTNKISLGDQLIDLKGFKMLGNEKNCRKLDAETKLLHIAVHSSRGNYNRRQGIRSTWGSMKGHRGWQISLNFLLGSSTSSSSSSSSSASSSSAQDQLISDIVRNETERWGDIIEGSFVDSYRNLTYKHLMGHKWLLESCPGVDVYIKTDDDVFVNVPKIIRWLSDEKRKTKLEQDFYCYILRGYSPWRTKRSKYYISKDEYPGDKYPDYCSGIGYIASPDLLRKLYGVSRGIKYVPIEDLFATGLLPKIYNRNWDRTFRWADKDTRNKGHVKLVDISGLYLNERYQVYKNWIKDEKDVENKWFFVLLETTNEGQIVLDQRSLWKKTMAPFVVDNVHEER